jgi:hypothetical protein
VRSDVLAYTFTGFLPGDRLNSDLDIDPDSGNSACCDILGVLFNNGAAPNATLSIRFSTSDFAFDFEVPDTSFSACSVFGDCRFAVGFDLPEPALPLLSAPALLALAARRRRERGQRA